MLTPTSELFGMVIYHASCLRTSLALSSLSLSLPLFPFVGDEVSPATFVTASSDSLFHPPLYHVFFFQSSSSPAFLTSLVTQSRHLSLGLLRLLLPSSLTSAALFVRLSSIRVLSIVICSSAVSRHAFSALLSLPLTPPFFSCLLSLLLLFSYQVVFAHLQPLWLLFCQCQGFSLRCPLVFLKSAGPPSPHQLFSKRSLRPVLFDVPLSPSSRLHTPLLPLQLDVQIFPLVAYVQHFRLL